MNSLWRSMYAAAAAFAPYDAMRAEMLELLDEGRAMRSIRGSEDLDDLRQCGITMRRLQPQVTAIRDRIQDMPLDTGREVPVRGEADEDAYRLAAVEVSDCPLVERRLPATGRRLRGCRSGSARGGWGALRRGGSCWRRRTSRRRGATRRENQ